MLLIQDKDGVRECGQDQMLWPGVFEALLKGQKISSLSFSEEFNSMRHYSTVSNQPRRIGAKKSKKDQLNKSL